LIKFLLHKTFEVVESGRIKSDDKMIQAEGVESLSEAELRQACRDRGLLGLLSVEEMRQQVCQKLIFCSFYVCGRRTSVMMVYT
jgi:hypothetical protein